MLQTDIEELRNRIAQTRAALGIDEKKDEVALLESQMAVPDFWTDQARARSIATRASALTEDVAVWDALQKECDDISVLAASDDDSMQGELQLLVDDILKRYAALEFRILFSGPYDDHDALFSIHAGTGGVDAMDWAQTLLRMYMRFCESMGWTVRIIDEARGGEAGIKSVSCEVSGRYAYGYLKSEHGVHRLVRISPFDAEGMRHTSFALMEVVPDLGDTETITVKPEELKIDVFRASGAGGQSVNTTDSAVRITHLPSGIVVTCQNERSQLQNKETALRYLRGKLQRLAEAQKEEERQALRGGYNEAAWGNQIRSYVLNPYRMVKDHRTQHETSDVMAVLDGDLQPFVEAFLRNTITKE